MRGEHDRTRNNTDRPLGSSPHARGTQWIDLVVIRSGRIIPACAGNTAPPHLEPRRRPDHPRMRGEHGRRTLTPARVDGSSPHARGTRANRSRRFYRLRIIPACAGNTVDRRNFPSRQSDHPRMRGEHPDGIGRLFAMSGSSPHARGTRSIRPENHNKLRIIPACAGNT